MKRAHIFEFEDAAWFPSWLRTPMTNVLVVLARALGVPTVLGDLVARVLDEHDLDHIVDLGSGGGGVMPDVLTQIRQRPGLGDTKLTLTDLHPNDDAVRLFNDDAHPEIRYERAPVDATDLAVAPTGLKTMVNCFHHMRPEQARKILESAQESGQPLLIYEMGDQMAPPLWALGLPIGLPIVALSSLFLTPFVRRLTPAQLLLTYLIPLVPIFYAWDGQASMPRIYSPADLDELPESDGYRWEKGPAKNLRGPKSGAYLLGTPTPTRPA